MAILVACKIDFKMQCFYSIGQLNECSHKLEKLQSELHRYQTYLDDALKSTTTSGQIVPPSQNNSPRLVNGSRPHRTSGGSMAEEESLSRSGSDSSVANPTLSHNKQSAPGTPQLSNSHGWVVVLYHSYLATFDSKHSFTWFLLWRNKL